MPKSTCGPIRATTFLTSTTPTCSPVWTGWTTPSASWDKAVELMPALTITGFKVGYDSVFTDQALSDRFCAGLLKLEPLLNAS